MIKVDYPLYSFFPINRKTASLIAQTASHFEALLTLEKENVILNAKSMLGLLSQTYFDNDHFVLVADGIDEKEAVNALLALIEN